MRILKMHNNADEVFDQFVKKQLEQTEVGPELAQHYFDQMKLPPPSSGEGTVATAAKSSWWRFFAGAVVVGAVAMVIYKTMQPQPAAQPSAKVAQPVAVAPDSAKRQASVATKKEPTREITTQVKQSNDTGKINQILTNNQAAAIEKSLSVDKVILAKSNEVEPPAVIKDTPQKSAVKVDSAAKRRLTAIELTKQKDSVYIIW